MPLELHPATQADAERAAEIEKDAYGGDLFSQILFPGPFPEPKDTEKNWRAEELAKTFREDPSMIGFAQWNINVGLQPPPKSRTFGPGANVEACEAVSAMMQGVRNARLKAKHVHLTLLHVDPKHQRRGAGRMLVTWGIEESKTLGLPAFLESSRVGHSLYLSCGFRDVDVHAIDFTKWGKPASRITYIMALEHS